MTHTVDEFNISESLRQSLRQARKVVVFTGAGVSAESGIPTFRDAMNGLWSQYRPEDLATREAFRANPKLVWEWYEWRRALVAKAQPNAAHVGIARLQDCVPELTIITQNVDGLHHAAGSRGVLELHGNIRRSKCFACERIALEWSCDRETPPRCPHCGGRLRPDVVWFAEPLPKKTFSIAQAAAETCDVLFSIGTSSLVYPAAELPQRAHAARVTVIQINPVPTPLSQIAAVNFYGKASAIVPAMLKAVWNIDCQFE
ncbi:MAG: SIR2 family NAD-dependent protein deacylase [Gammaproteobacteria bacterium]